MKKKLEITKRKTIAVTVTFIRFCDSSIAQYIFSLMTFYYDLKRHYEVLEKKFKLRTQN